MGYKEIKSEDLGNHFDEIIDRMNRLSFRPILSKIRELLLSEIGLNFYTHGHGTWPPRKHEGDGHPLLILTQALLKAATGIGPGTIEEYTDKSLTIGVSGDVIPYAAIHNFGGETGRPGHRFIMPKREYMTVRDEVGDFCQELIADYGLEKIWG